MIKISSIVLINHELYFWQDACAQVNRMKVQKGVKQTKGPQMYFGLISPVTVENWNLGLLLLIQGNGWQQVSSHFYIDTPSYVNLHEINTKPHLSHQSECSRKPVNSVIQMRSKHSGFLCLCHRHHRKTKRDLVRDIAKGKSHTEIDTSQDKWTFCARLEDKKDKTVLTGIEENYLEKRTHCQLQIYR